VRRDGQSATRRRPNKLLNITVFATPGCVNGTYYTEVEGWSYVKDLFGLVLDSHGFASSPSVTITNC
jgi:hypothetical protein